MEEGGQHRPASSRRFRTTPGRDRSGRGDRDRALQVLSNLLGNALKFTQPGGRVRLSAHVADAEVVFAVSDTGPGIAPEHVPLVFDRFWQATRERREGIGLGLAIAKAIVHAHGGRIWVERPSAGGASFCFTLPSRHPDAL